MTAVEDKNYYFLAKAVSGDERILRRKCLELTEERIAAEDARFQVMLCVKSSKTGLAKLPIEVWRLIC